MELKHRLFIDVDAGDGWLWRTPTPMWDDLLPLVKMEALRLGRLYPLGSKAIIKRSDDGWFIIFPEARLSKEEEEIIMIVSRGHRGHVYFSCLIHDTTLRVSEKPKKHSHKPYLVEVLKVR